MTKFVSHFMAVLWFLLALPLGSTSSFDDNMIMLDSKNASTSAPTVSNSSSGSPTFSPMPSASGSGNHTSVAPTAIPQSEPPSQSPAPSSNSSSNSSIAPTLSPMPSIGPSPAPSTSEPTPSPSTAVPDTPAPTKAPHTAQPTKQYPTPSPTSADGKKKHKISVWKILGKTLAWMILIALALLLFGAIMSNRYRIYYYGRSAWFSFLRWERTQWVIRKLRLQRLFGGNSQESTLNEIIFENDLSEGLLMQNT